MVEKREDPLDGFRGTRMGRGQRNHSTNRSAASPLGRRSVPSKSNERSSRSVRSSAALLIHSIRLRIIRVRSEKFRVRHLSLISQMCATIAVRLTESFRRDWRIHRRAVSRNPQKKKDSVSNSNSWQACKQPALC